ncbi:MAG TPA: sugar phosphate nucleotidyltransferase [Chthonomonadaceae bacterium]|nr:sugar phosphate nucleotidyltransferase [Chthonomonadaceae bacterium]
MSVLPSTPVPSRIQKAVIPAAGLGTRLRPLTRAIPKELLPVGRQPVLAYVAEELRGAGITQALFIVSENKPQIRAFFGAEHTGDTARADLPTLRCDYVIQKEQRGSGDALLYAEEWVGAEPFVVAFGDCLIEADPPGDPSEPLRRLMATHTEHDAAASVLVEAVSWDKVSRYGVLAPERPLPSLPTEPFAAADIIEKPAREEAPSNLVVAARLTLQPAIFPALRRTPLDARGELNMIDAVRALRRAGAPLWAVPLRAGEARRDIGNFESFFAAFVRAALRDPEAGEAARQAVEEVLHVTESPSASDPG